MGASLTGCAGPVRVEPLATGQPGVAAFQLFGPTLTDLRLSAGRLCPQGGQVMRSAETRTDRMPPTAGRVMRWLDWTAEQVSPAPKSAQLLVVCDPQPDAVRIAGNAPAQVAANGAGIVAPKPADPRMPGLPPPSQAPVTGYDE
jgi:hypothetical protein